MKNLKFIAALFPVFLVAVFIYLATTGASENSAVVEVTNVINTTEKPSDLCNVGFSMNSLDPSCLPGSYKICVNGGLPVTVGDTFNLYLECGGTYTVCANSTSGGCSGSVTVYVPCPCGPMRIQKITLSTETAPCVCQ